jgi:hypothetical protein
MKKIFTILAVLSLLMAPCVSMAALQQASDTDLAAITGQSGVTIHISAMHIELYLGTLTYGDLDGFTTVNSFGNDFTNAGFIDVSFFPGLMYIQHR